MRHVNDALGPTTGGTPNGAETDDPGTWKFTASDRLFLEIISEAHAQGFRLALEADLDYAASASSDSLEQRIIPLTARWMDPDGNLDPADGVDGWVARTDGDFWKRLGPMWRLFVRRTNPEAVVVGDLRGSALGAAAAAEFDLVIGYDPAGAIAAFFSSPEATGALERLADELASATRRYGKSHSPVGSGLILPFSGPGIGRMLSAICPSGKEPGENERDRWRLAAVLHHFYAAAPMTLYGDEVGMYGQDAVDAPLAMWWNDPPGAAQAPAHYRGDFLALVRILNALREQYASLRHGDFQLVLLDEGRRIFAFRRALPNEQAVVVINYGSANHRVLLPAGRAGRLVRVIEPQLKPAGPSKPGKDRPAEREADPAAVRLRVNGTRQFADDLGRMSLWVAPMSVRIALIIEGE